MVKMSESEVAVMEKAKKEEQQGEMVELKNTYMTQIHTMLDNMKWGYPQKTPHPMIYRLTHSCLVGFIDELPGSRTSCGR